MLSNIDMYALITSETDYSRKDQVRCMEDSPWKFEKKNIKVNLGATAPFAGIFN